MAIFIIMAILVKHRVAILEKCGIIYRSFCTYTFLLERGKKYESNSKFKK